MCLALESTNPPSKWTVAKIENNTMSEKRLEVVSEYPLNNFYGNGSDFHDGHTSTGRRKIVFLDYFVIKQTPMVSLLGWILGSK